MIIRCGKKNKTQGFTLVELLLVIGIIATLAMVTFVALDPAKRFQDARNARRVSDVETVLSAVHQYVIDNRGSFPAGIVEDEERILGTDVSGCTSSSGGCAAAQAACLDLTTDLARYLKIMPYDPQNGSATNTQYSILRDSNGILTVTACDAEESTISISR